MAEPVIEINSENCMFTNKKVANKILLLFEVTSNSDIEVRIPKTITHPDTDPNNEKTETFCSHSKTIALQSDKKFYKCTFIDVGGISSIKLEKEIGSSIELDAIPSELSTTYPGTFILGNSSEYKYSSDKTSSAAADVVSAAITAAVENATAVNPLVLASETSSTETSSTETSSTETSYDKSVDEFVTEFSNSLIGSTKAVNELLRITGTSNSIPNQNTVQRTGNIIKAIIKAIEAKEAIKKPFVITFKCTHIEHHIKEEVIYFRNDLLNKHAQAIEDAKKRGGNFSVTFKGNSFNIDDKGNTEPIETKKIKESYLIDKISNTTSAMYTNVYINETYGNNNITTGNIASTSVTSVAKPGDDEIETFSFNGDITKVSTLFDNITHTILATAGGMRKYGYTRKHKLTSKKKIYKKHTHKTKSKKRKTYKKHKHNKSAKSKKLHR